MTEAEVEIIIQAALERYPGVKARIITDNGPQFIARDFKEFIRIAGLTHVKTSPYYPQSNGKIERWHQTLKAGCLRPGCPLSLEDAQRLVEHFVTQCACIRPSVTSPLAIASPPATWKSLLLGTKSSMQPAKTVN